MSRRWVLLIIAANLAVLLALVFAYPHLMISPGALKTAHAELNTDCFACHQPWRGVSSPKCITCHALPDIGLKSTKGQPLTRAKLKATFHQSLIASDCMACHSDHEGPKLTQGSRKAFSHALLRADVRGTCQACHTAPTDDMHRNVASGCGQCHTADRWKPANFEHSKFFLLDKDHATDCVTCHVGSNYKRYTCYGCHEHSPSNIKAKHEEEGITDFDNCARCHRSAEGEPGERGEGGGSRGRSGHDD